MNKQEKQFDTQFESLERELGLFRTFSPSRGGLSNLLASVTVAKPARLTSQGRWFWQLRTYTNVRYALSFAVILLVVVGLRGQFWPGVPQTTDDLAIAIEQADLSQSTQLENLITTEEDEVTSIEVAMAEI